MLGTYTSQHSHPIGPANAKFTSISVGTQELIEEKL